MAVLGFNLTVQGLIAEFVWWILAGWKDKGGLCAAEA